MRGKVDIAHFAQQLVGITPAYAGKRFPFSLPAARLKDHPRVCGEKLKSNDEDVTYKGSPPRMRGKAILDYMGVPTKRITPAYAGKSSSKA